MYSSGKDMIYGIVGLILSVALIFGGVSLLNKTTSNKDPKDTTENEDSMTEAPDTETDNSGGDQTTSTNELQVLTLNDLDPYYFSNDVSIFRYGYRCSVLKPDTTYKITWKIDSSVLNYEGDKIQFLSAPEKDAVMYKVEGVGYGSETQAYSIFKMDQQDLLQCSIVVKLEPDFTGPFYLWLFDFVNLESDKYTDGQACASWIQNNAKVLSISIVEVR